MAIKINPLKANSYPYIIYSERGYAKSSLKDYAGAVDDLTRAISIDPKNSEYYFERGKLKIILGQKESACIDFSKAGKLGRKEAFAEIKKYCK